MYESWKAKIRMSDIKLILLKRHRDYDKSSRIIKEILVSIVSFVLAFAIVSSFIMSVDQSNRERIEIQMGISIRRIEKEKVTPHVEEKSDAQDMEIIFNVTDDNKIDGTIGKVSDGTGTDTTAQWICYEKISEELKSMFHEIASEYEVNEAFILGICYNESRFNPSAVNTENENGSIDWGIGQCNDSTFSTLKRLIGLGQMSDVLNAEIGIRACCALFDYYKDMGFSDRDALLAYQMGLSNYKAVMDGTIEPWPAYQKVLRNVEIYEKHLFP